jgi:Domain of unknown function (DUF4349)/Putative zinc-finger
MNSYSSTEHHPIDAEELMAYLDGELPADRAAAALAHLERCLECKALAADLRKISQQLLAWEIESRELALGKDVIAALEAATPEEDRSEPRKASGGRAHRRDGWMIRRWYWVGAFATVCLLAGLSTTVFRTVRMADMAERPNVSAYLLPSQEAKQEGGLALPAAPASTPVNGRQLDRLQQFAKLQNPPPVKFKNDTDGIPHAPMIARTAALTLTTKDFDTARARLEEILKRHGGYIGDLSVNTPSGSARGFTSSLRVPADQLEAALAELRRLGRVESESQNGEEVTSQYVDLEARLSNSRNTEERLTALLRDRTGKLSDVLAVENELSRVRGEIESMQAERKTLLHRVDFATINATVREDFQAQLQVVPVSTWTQLRNAAVDGYRTMIDGLIGAVLFVFSYAPSLLLWCAILFFPARAIWKRFSRAKFMSREII